MDFVSIERSKITEKIKLGVIFGGRSGEHAVSLMSTRRIIEGIDSRRFDLVKIGIDKEGTWYQFLGDIDTLTDDIWQRDAEKIEISQLPNLVDFVLPMIHGSYGEDGSLQGLLEMIGIPYGGCGVMASAICMDKSAAKDVFIRSGIPTAKYLLVRASRAEEDPDIETKRIMATFSGPVFIKPANMGSSLGISKARTREEIREGLLTAARFNRRIIVEEAIEGRELEVALIGNEKPLVGGIGEIKATTEYYDYDAKYSGTMGTKLIIPADLDRETEMAIEETAKEAYMAADCAGFARIDFFIQKETGKIYINEINTIPGFTEYSMFPLLMKEGGLELPELIERIVELGYERYNDQNNRQKIYR